MYYTYIIEMNSRIQHVTNVYSVTLKNSNSRFNSAENEFVGRGGGAVIFGITQQIFAELDLQTHAPNFRPKT